MGSTVRVQKNREMKAISLLIHLFLSVAFATIETAKSEIVNVHADHCIIKRKVAILASNQLSIRPSLQPSTARALLVSCAVLYGSNYPLTKLLQDSLNPSLVTTLRFMIASAFFLPSTIDGLRGETRLSVGSIELGIWCSIGFISQAMILTKTSASKAAFFCGLSVLMPPIFHLIESSIESMKLMRSGDVKIIQTDEQLPAIHKDRSSSLMYKLCKTPFVKPFLALCGAAILEWGSGMQPAQLSDLSLLITPVSFAMCFWRSAYLGTRYPTEIAAITGIMLSTVAIIGVGWSCITLNFCCRTGLTDLPSECSKLISALCEWRVLCGLLYSGIFTTAFTSFVEQKVIRVLTAAETTLIYTLEPLFATSFAAFFLKEHITYGTLTGAAFIILACLWDTIIDCISNPRGG